MTERTRSHTHTPDCMGTNSLCKIHVSISHVFILGIKKEKLNKMIVSVSAPVQTLGRNSHSRDKTLQRGV